MEALGLITFTVVHRLLGRPVREHRSLFNVTWEL
jgi:hypothetical protein